MPKQILFTNNAPAPIGPYSQGVWAGDLLFLSGQIAINPENGEMVTQDIVAETKQVMHNIGALLKAAGLSYDNIVKTSIFLKSMNDFGQVNQIYGEYFDNDTAPARETVEVARLPKDVNIEISITALKG